MKNVFVILIAALLTGCATAMAPVATPTCAEVSADYVAQLDIILPEWDDATLLASNTPRVGLPGVVSDLQGIARRVEALEPPECAQDTHAQLLLLTQGTVEGFMSFMAQDEDDARIKFRVAENAQAEFVEMMAALRQ